MRYIFSLLFIILVFQYGHAQQVSYVYDENSQDDHEYILEDSYLYMLMSLPLNTQANTFEQASRYGFSDVRYSRRGYDYRYSKFNISGIELNDAIGAGAYWDLLRALSDYRDVRLESFGQSNRGSRASSFSAQTEYDLSSYPITSYKRLGLILTSRLYRYGANLKIADIDEDSGYYYAATASVRMGDDAHIDGLYRNDFRFNLMFGRRWASGDPSQENKHELGFYGSVAPIEQSVRGASTMESFALTDNNLYNPYWGFDEDGNPLSARIKNNTLAILGGRYEFRAKDELLITLDAATIFGYTSTSRIGWSGAANPYPDYYTYMPSYFRNSNTSSNVEAAWRNLDSDFTQISWSRLYGANAGDGSSAACYYIESDVRHINDYQAALTFIHELGNGVEFNGGANINLSRSLYHKRLEDDMSGLFIYDTDPYVDPSYEDPFLNCNDLNDVGRVVEQGDRFGYNYRIINNKYSAWFGTVYNQIYYSIYADLKIASNSFVREGYYAKAIYDSSITMGRSRYLDFEDYNFALGGRLRLSAHSRLEAQVVVGAQPPALSDMFFDARYSEITPENLSSSKYRSVEFVYRYTTEYIDFYAAAYRTVTRSESDICRYYDDLGSRYVHAAYCDIAKNYMGFELSAEYAVYSNFILSGTFALAENIYASDMNAEIQAFTSGDIISTSTVSRVKGLRVDDSPQLVSNIEFRYRGRRMFNASIGASLMAKNYISISPVMRNDASVAAALSPENQAELMSQEQFPAAMTLNLSLSKTLDIQGNYLSLFLTVSNLLDNRNIIYSGYEQNRLYSVGDDVNACWAAPDSKYYYGYGRTMYISLNFKF